MSTRIAQSRKALTVGAALMGLLLIPAGAHGSPTRVTRGDAEAVFQAFNNGGWAIRLQPGPIEGAPADFLQDSLARISTTGNNRHYCALDWHALFISLVEGNRPGETLTNQEIWTNLKARQITYQLDGAPLDAVRTEPRRTTNPQNRGFYEAFYVNVGRIFAPDELAAGQHTLVATGSLAGVISNITFVIDAPGTGVCGSDDALTFREVSSER